MFSFAIFSILALWCLEFFAKLLSYIIVRLVTIIMIVTAPSLIPWTHVTTWLILIRYVWVVIVRIVVAFATWRIIIVVSIIKILFKSTWFRIIRTWKVSCISVIVMKKSAISLQIVSTVCTKAARPTSSTLHWELIEIYIFTNIYL